MEVTNDRHVGVLRDTLVVMRPPTVLTKQEAINLAAWLVVLADTLDGEAVPFDVVRALIERI
jgi:hypothetical protein